MISTDLHSLKQALKVQRVILGEEFNAHTPITALINKWVLYIDALLIALFQKHHLNHHFCLLSLGSFGRRELLLYSDIDILILHIADISSNELQAVQLFIQDCWDLGLDLSHQVTPVSACSDLAAQDLTVISSLLDMRFLAGQQSLMYELQYVIHPLHMWNSHDYFFAKQQEQNQRHAKYNDTAYHLEPNIKYGVGGLRDIQIIFQISKRNVSQSKIMTEREYDILMHCQKELQYIRFALHQLAGKREERLLFDYQVKLAAYFGYQDLPESLAIEQWMKHYFKLTKQIHQLNEMLLQWFSETIIHHEKQHLSRLDPYFQLSNHDIEVYHPKHFIQHPEALFQLFLWIAEMPAIENIRASTIRLIHTTFANLVSQSLQPILTPIFFKILKAKNPYKALNLMSQYGVLNHYLSCYDSVTGQMQYDLYHVYTVEQHTLFVIRNITRFTFSESPHLLCHELIRDLDNKPVLYLAALFHDIGKGRGGSHEEWGAYEALKNAERWQMSVEDTALFTWLVRHHLLMSHTAQRQDIYDPKTIELFCAKLPHKHYLEYLYLLTVADICATNPALWNSWKDSLLKELYFLAKTCLQQSDLSHDEDALLANRQKLALDYLVKKGYQAAEVQGLWRNFKTKYFFHESPKMIARQTKAILEATSFPVILILPHHSQGGTEIFIYMPHRDDRFAITTTVLNNHHITIQEAFISTCDNAFNLDTYIVLDNHNQQLLDKSNIREIKQALQKALSHAHTMPAIIQQRLSRQQAHFTVLPKISFTDDHALQQTKLFFVASDRPGLLARVSQIFLSEQIILHNAKVVTAGNRVEDMFYISTRMGMTLSAHKKKHLKSALLSV